MTAKRKAQGPSTLDTLDTRPPRTFPLSFGGRRAASHPCRAGNSYLLDFCGLSRSWRKEANAFFQLRLLVASQSGIAPCAPFLPLQKSQHIVCMFQSLVQSLANLCPILPAVVVRLRTLCSASLAGSACRTARDMRAARTPCWPCWPCLVQFGPRP